jgi:trehalose 6-phosphate synthase
MNLVAKEFIAAHDDEDGVLVLSKFTGAATELLDALIVNPYDIEGVAEAIHQALEMDIDERRKRMHRMRQHLMDHNIYRWAASILDDLRELRMDSSKTTNPVHARPATSLPAEESNPERKQEASIR